MDSHDLSESAWKRASAESARIYPTIGFGVAASLATIIFGAVAAVAAAGEDTTTQVAYPIIGGALALALTFGVLFAIQLAVAPVRQRNELRAAWKAPPEVQTVNVPLSLRDLRRKGIELLHRYKGMGIGRAEELEFEEWADGVVAFAAQNLSESEAKDFIQAGETEASALMRLNSRIEALQSLISNADEQ